MQLWRAGHQSGLQVNYQLSGKTFSLLMEKKFFSTQTQFSSRETQSIRGSLKATHFAYLLPHPRPHPWHCMCHRYPSSKLNNLGQRSPPSPFACLCSLRRSQMFACPVQHTLSIRIKNVNRCWYSRVQ